MLVSHFTIKDLEALSGIKAHTIRMWEKRYGLLSPVRSETNIRSYSVKCLRKLLSVSLLNNNGVKISKIANMTDNEIFLQVKEYSFKSSEHEEVMNTLKLSMLTFDKVLFNTTYNSLLSRMSFREIVGDVFFPFLQRLGFLWQMGVIEPVHEHFMANLITHKIQLNTEKIDYNQDNDAKTYVLFLPEHEVHQIALLYLNYELIIRGFKTIYLGQDLALDNLDCFINSSKKVSFVTCLTVRPYEEDIHTYFDDVVLKLEGSSSEFIAFGGKVSLLKKDPLSSKVSLFDSLFDLISSL